MLPIIRSDESSLVNSILKEAQMEDEVSGGGGKGFMPGSPGEGIKSLPEWMQGQRGRSPSTGKDVQLNTMYQEGDQATKSKIIEQYKKYVQQAKGGETAPTITPEKKEELKNKIVEKKKQLTTTPTPTEKEAPTPTTEKEVPTPETTPAPSPSIKTVDDAVSSGDVSNLNHQEVQDYLQHKYKETTGKDPSEIGGIDEVKSFMNSLDTELNAKGGDDVNVYNLGKSNQSIGSLNDIDAALKGKLPDKKQKEEESSKYWEKQHAKDRALKGSKNVEDALKSSISGTESELTDSDVGHWLKDRYDQWAPYTRDTSAKSFQDHIQRKVLQNVKLDDMGPNKTWLSEDAIEIAMHGGGDSWRDKK